MNVYEICRHTHPSSQALANELSLRNNFMKQYLLTKEAMLNFFVFFHVKKVSMVLSDLKEGYENVP